MLSPIGFVVAKMLIRGNFLDCSSFVKSMNEAFYFNFL